MTFNDLLKSMLSDLDAGKCVDEIVKERMKELQLPGNSQSAVLESVTNVDRIMQANEDLQEAKKKGASKEEWLDCKVEAMVEKLSDVDKEKANAVMAIIKEKGINIISEE